jgi:tetratricopeptide (TPR) repeat protein
MFRVKSSRREQRVAQAVCVSRLLLLDTGNVNSSPVEEMMFRKPWVRVVRSSTVAVLFVVVLGCSSQSIPRFGVGGRYEEGIDQFNRGRGGSMDTAVTALEYVVSQDPTYKKSLTYLGRAYYRKGRYQDAFAVLQRALAVDKEDEIAWIALGATQLRLNQVDKGIESLKGGITLANRVMVDGYHNFLYWDTRGLIHASLRRCAFLITKGPDEKDGIIQNTERLLALVDDEENFQRNTRIQNERPLYGK